MSNWNRICDYCYGLGRIMLYDRRWRWLVCSECNGSGRVQG